MLFDGIKLVEGSEFQNAIVDSGSSFPLLPSEGELFYRNDGANEALYVYNGTAWIRQVSTGDSFDTFLPDVGVPGTYKSVTVSSKGIVTSGTNPTTLAGYEITDAQPLDADLTAIAALSGTSGFLTKTASNTWALNTSTFLTGNQNITVSGDVTGSGSTSLTLTLSTTGVAAGSYGTSNSVPTIIVSAGGRITSASNTSIAIDTSSVTSGTFANARISSASIVQHQSSLAITESQITDGSILARNNSDETIGGNWTFIASVSGQTPTQAAHLANKAYVDNIASGVVPQKSVKVASTANITLSGVQTIDGISLVAGDRVLVKDQTTGANNGVYIVGAGSWTRATDFDGNPTAEVQTGSLIYVESGAANGNSSWVLVTSGTIVVGSTALTFSLFSRAGELIAGTGLTKSGNTFNVITANAGRISVLADSIDLATTGVTAGTYTKLTVDAYGRVTTGTSLVSLDVTTALGFTPYSASNPSAYITSAGAPVQSVAGRTGTVVLVQADIGGLTTTSSPTFASLNTTGGITGTSFNSITGLSSTTPTAAGLPAVGTGTTAARADHVHPLQTTVSGNAGTATVLATGRTFSVSGDATGTSAAFNGSANASIPVTFATVGTPVTDGFVKITTDTKGRVSGTTVVAQADITGLLGAGSITNAMLANSAVNNLSGTNTGDQTISLTGEVTGSGNGSFTTTLSNAAVISKTLTGFTSGTGTITATDSILTAIQKLNGNLVANGSGTVTSVSVTSANGVSGTVATNTTTPAITLTLGAITPTSVAATSTVTGSNLSGTNTGDNAVNSNYAGDYRAANFVAGTNYQAPIGTISGLVKGNGANALTAAVVRTDYAEPTTALATGLLKNTTVTGAHSIAVAGTDYLVPSGALGTPSSGVATNLTGTATGLTAGTVITNANLTGEVTSVGNAVTVSNSAVIGKVLTGFTSGAGTITATDTILSAIQKLNANIIANPSGTVTSVAGVGTVNGLTLSGTVTSSGSLTLGGTLSGISNTALTNSSVTVGTTAISLGASSTVLAGLTSVTSTGFTGALTGNATTATTLATARTINGIAFDGSSNITVAAAAGTLTGVVAIASGGTGQTTAEAAIDALGGAAINPVTPKDGDIQIQAGPIISIYATGAYRQIFPAVYS